MKKIFFIFLFMCVIFPSFAGAQETVYFEKMVITATRTEEPVESVASSVTVITAEEIEARQATTVLELLRSVKGFDVVQNGGIGKRTSVFVRGGNSGHILVMIDGVQVNSPTTGSYDFANLTVDNIDRIEIIRGPQSPLYGSDAMAGVINIIRKRGKGAPTLIITEEGGTFETYRNSFSAAGSTEKLSYSVSISRMETEGFSSASEKNGNTEDDGYENKSLSGKVGLKFSASLGIDLGISYSEARSDLDYYYDSGTYEMTPDALNYEMGTKAFTPYIKAVQKINNNWDHTIMASLDETSVTEKKDSTTTSEIDTTVKNINWQHNLYLAEETNTLTFGVEYEEQEGENGGEGNFKKYIHNKAFYLQDQASIFNERLNVSLGVRVDDHNIFGEETTSRITALYNLNSIGTKFKGSWGSAFKAPSLNDLYYNASWGIGNPELKPEKSTGYDIGFEQEISDLILISANYFENDFKNLIQWDWSIYPMTPENISKAETKGYEFGFNFKPVSSFYIDASCTLLDTEDKSTGNELARRANNKGAITVGWTPEKAGFNLTVNKIGKRWDNGGNTNKLRSYTKVDFAASFDITKNLTLFGRGENLLNEDYEEAKGYGTAGISYYGGLKASF
ncbi:MAG: TonB-dependent receptor [bacterium]|nr:TonB-dependent receptor [bacterium]